MLVFYAATFILDWKEKDSSEISSSGWWRGGKESGKLPRKQELKLWCQARFPFYNWTLEPFACGLSTPNLICCHLPLSLYSSLLAFPTALDLCLSIKVSLEVRWFKVGGIVFPQKI